MDRGCTDLNKPGRRISSTFTEDHIVDSSLVTNIETFRVAADQFNSLNLCRLNSRQVGGHIIGLA